MKEKKKKDSLQDFVNWLMPRIPDWLTGRTSVMEEKCHIRYGEKDCSKLIEKIKLDNLKRYITILGVFLFFLILTVGSSILSENSDGLIKKEGAISYLERPKLGEKMEEHIVNVELVHKNGQIKEAVVLQVNTRKLTNQQKKKLLKEYAKALPDLILGDNKSLQQVSKPLNLVERDVETEITTSWYSSNPQIITETGQVDLLKVGKGKKVVLIGKLELGELYQTKKIDIWVKSAKKQEDVEKVLESRLATLTKEIKDSDNGNRLVLPSHLEDGISLKWESHKKSSGLFLIFLLILTAFIIFQGRYEKIDKERKMANESMLRDFPGLVNKLVLLLNAGLVATTALAKIADDYSNSKTERRELYEELCEIEKRVKGTNLSVITELRDFAQRSGVRELMRFSTILGENINKGTTLAEKLEIEAEFLWLCRKKQAEEKGRLAETKLTVPLLILLITLIMITVAPALMEM